MPKRPRDEAPAAGAAKPRPLRLRNWAVTINSIQNANGTWNPLAPWPRGPYELCVKRCIAQLERAPTTGTLHWQGYIEFERQLYFKDVVRMFPRGTHIEKATKVALANYRYCVKKDSTRVEGQEPYMFGDWSLEASGQHGGQNRPEAVDEPALKRQKCESTVFKGTIDSNKAHQLIKDGVKVDDILDQARGFGVIRAKEITAAWTRNIVRSIPHKRSIFIEVRWGDTGTGKTTTAIRDYYDPDLHQPPYVHIPSYGKWFPGLSGSESVIVIDEMLSGLINGVNCDRWPIWFLMALFDGNRVRLEDKGIWVIPGCTMIVLTSNYHPDTWYMGTAPETTRQALLDRIRAGRIIHYAGDSYRSLPQNQAKAVKKTPREMLPIEFLLPHEQREISGNVMDELLAESDALPIFEDIPDDDGVLTEAHPAELEEDHPDDDGDEE